ncbi:MAG: hypothetical protein AAF092_15015 [Pseudomonadota bacterium]
MGRLIAIFLTVLFSSTQVISEQIKLDWNDVELGFFERSAEDGGRAHGLAVHVPSSRIATEDDFYAVLPVFCSDILPALLEFVTRIDGAPEVAIINLQFDFYGPKVGEVEPYLAFSATFDLFNGGCPET